MVTLNNSLLDCVDYYGREFNQYSVMGSEQGNSSNKKQQISELNNPHSFINTISKDQMGGFLQDYNNIYNI